MTDKSNCGEENNISFQIDEGIPLECQRSEGTLLKLPVGDNLWPCLRLSSRLGTGVFPRVFNRVTTSNVAPPQGTLNIGESIGESRVRVSTDKIDFVKSVSDKLRQANIAVREETGDLPDLILSCNQTPEATTPLSPITPDVSFGLEDTFRRAGLQAATDDGACYHAGTVCSSSKDENLARMSNEVDNSAGFGRQQSCPTGNRDASLRQTPQLAQSCPTGNRDASLRQTPQLAQRSISCNNDMQVRYPPSNHYVPAYATNAQKDGQCRAMSNGGQRRQRVYKSSSGYGAQSSKDCKKEGSEEEEEEEEEEEGQKEVLVDPTNQQQVTMAINSPPCLSMNLQTVTSHPDTEAPCSPLTTVDREKMLQTSLSSESGEDLEVMSSSHVLQTRGLVPGIQVAYLRGDTLELSGPYVDTPVLPGDEAATVGTLSRELEQELQKQAYEMHFTNMIQRGCSPDEITQFIRQYQELDDSDSFMLDIDTQSITHGMV